MTHQFAVNIKSISDAGRFTGYAAVFNVADLSGEKISPGAFRSTLASRDQTLPLLLSHDTKEPVGIFRVLKEDSKGLYVEGELNLDTQKGKDTYSLMKQGALGGLSIAFLPDKFTLNKDGTRTITALTLLEISLTPVAAQPLARVTSVRSFQTEEGDETEDWASIIQALEGFVNSD